MTATITPGEQGEQGYHRLTLELLLNTTELDYLASYLATQGWSIEEDEIRDYLSGAA